MTLPSSAPGPFPRPRGVALATALAVAFGLVSSCGGPRVAGPSAPPPGGTTPMHSVIPLPVSVAIDPAVRFTITDQTVILAETGNDEARRIGGLLSDLIGTATRKPLPVTSAAGPPGPGTIYLGTDAANPSLGTEGYELAVTADRIRIVANAPAGLFYGLQTLRHLMPASIEYRAALARPVPVPGARITDYPRFAWRGAMLDVARHFFGVQDVEHYIDLISMYKLNHLHLHLTDDQGWRIEIKSWPNLTAHGGSTAVWGGRGGFYTRQDYAEIVRYAADRFVTIVPEIEMPSHSNAALASYPELNCDGKAPALYTGIEVGFSSFCVDSDITYRFLTDVVRELAAMTPGPYIHVGGDEVKTLTPVQYKQFMERAQAIVAAQGKQVIGWDEMANIERLPTTLVQHWRPEFKQDAADMKLVLSPAQKIYLDMKYDASTPIGLDWAARIEAREAYDWDPTTLAGVPERSIVGIEAPIWSETLKTMADVEYMAFPRLPGAAEIGWSPAAARHWEEYRLRLGAQAPRWSALGINAYRSPQVPWTN
jgi:hexosaminidase